jgi:hypothetical protein
MSLTTLSSNTSEEIDEKCTAAPHSVIQYVLILPQDIPVRHHVVP